MNADSHDTALEWAGLHFTFAELDERARRVAAVLRQRGFRAGDRLCVQLANTITIIDISDACSRLGVIFVPINVLYREREVAHILADAEPKWFITERELPELEVDAPPPVFPELFDDAPAALIYTSGTTGTPKGAILARRNFDVNARSLVEAWRITSSDRLLLALPRFHLHALGHR